jgi:hypothetical protein
MSVTRGEAMGCGRITQSMMSQRVYVNKCTRAEFCRRTLTIYIYIYIYIYTQNVQLKSGPYFNMSNLFTKIYMLYYTTNLYLQQVLEMMSIHFNALIDTFHHVPRNFS